MAKAKKRYVLGEGYPWYNLDKGMGPGQSEGRYSITLYTKPGSFGFPQGTKKVPLNIQFGAWKKVRLVLEVA
jgi:hypothetical protein